MTTIQLDGADPVPTYDGPVEVALAATDAGGSGVELSQYRVDAGAFTDYTAPFTVSGEGEHTVEYRSRDVAGNVEETKSVTFTIETGGGGGGDCLSQSDEFDGSALDPKWDVLRQAGAGPQVAGGSLGLEIRQGDFIANDPLAENTLLQDAPSGEWTVTTRLDTSQIDANGEQAGLVIWKSENPNTFSKIVAIQANSGSHQFEHIVTQDGGVDPPIPQSITPAPGGQLPDQVLLRARYDGTNVIGEFSADNGQSWTLIGQEGHAAPLEAPLRVGLVAFRGGNGGGTASFDWFRVQEGSDPGGPVCEPGGACPPALSDEFEGNQIDTDRWSLVRGAPGMDPSVSDGQLVLPVTHGDIDGANTGAISYVAQPAPDGAWEVTTKVTIEHTNEWQHGGLMMWVDDDNYTKFAFTMNPSGTRFIEYWTETDGARDTHVPNIDDPGGWPDTMYLRLTSDGESELAAAYSTDGESWTELEGVAPLWTDEGTQIGVNAMADEGTGDITAAFDYVRFTPDEAGCPENSCDQFDGTELDPKWELVNPVPTSPPTVSDGHLNLPIIPGDLFGGNGTAQLLLQPAPADDSWVATAKIAHANIDTNGEAAGLALINTVRAEPLHEDRRAVQERHRSRRAGRPAGQVGRAGPDRRRPGGDTPAGAAALPELRRARSHRRLRLGPVRLRRLDPGDLHLDLHRRDELRQLRPQHPGRPVPERAGRPPRRPVRQARRLRRRRGPDRRLQRGPRQRRPADPGRRMRGRRGRRRNPADDHGDDRSGRSGRGERLVHDAGRGHPGGDRQRGRLRASIRPSTRSTAPPSSPTPIRSRSPTTASTRSSTARPTSRATSRRPSRSSSGSTRALPGPRRRSTATRSPSRPMTVPRAPASP